MDLCLDSILRSLFLNYSKRIRLLFQTSQWFQTYFIFTCVYIFYISMSLHPNITSRFTKPLFRGSNAYIDPIVHRNSSSRHFWTYLQFVYTSPVLHFHRVSLLPDQTSTRLYLKLNSTLGFLFTFLQLFKQSFTYSRKLTFSYTYNYHPVPSLPSFQTHL